MVFIKEPFGNDEQVIVRSPPAAVLRQVAVSALLALGCSALAMAEVWSRHPNAVYIGCFVVQSLFLYWIAFRQFRPRLVFTGPRFEFKGVIGEAHGQAYDFIGCAEAFGPLGESLKLLRRSDLEWISLRPIRRATRLDEETVRWRRTFLVSVSVHGVRRIREQSETLSEVRATALLAIPVAARKESTSLELTLASAARAAAMNRYSSAKRPLEQLFLALDADSIAMPYVFDALQLMGDAATARLLDQHWQRLRDTPIAARAAALLCKFAEPSLTARVAELAAEPNLYVKRCSRTALERLREYQD